MTGRWGAVGLAAAALLGCANTGWDLGSAPVPTTSPDIRGTLTKVATGEGGGSMLIEEKPNVQEGNKLLLRLNSATVMLRPDGKRLSFSAFQAGQAVQAWVTGPIMESYPGQATAGTIMLLGGP